jgi:DNA-binding response OmpR family regulator
MDTIRGCRVLVIDDMREMEEMMCLLLAHERDDQVTFARGGRQALALAEQDPPQLVILDLMMPDMHGYEVFRRLKAIPSLQNVPVILLTVLPSPMVYPEARRLGIAGYVCKPFEFQDLAAARDAVLNGETYYPPVPVKHKHLDRLTA